MNIDKNFFFNENNNNKKTPVVNTCIQSMTPSKQRAKPPVWVSSQWRALPPYKTAWPVDQGHDRNQHIQNYESIKHRI